ncbi:MAG: hypothetical protein DCC71_09815 [Proteobacteria bacterium]|nr:MAG: hypothetical protein DCC71_09815 [Pseudomonadota bacterium]
MRRTLPILLVVLIAVLFLGGQVVRSRLGIELSAEAVRDLVLSLGWKAGAVFVGLVTFRQFLFLPSAVVLPAGGLVFGMELGTALGALGIFASAAIKYTIARSLGREWLRPHFGAAVDAFERRAAAAGPVIVGLVTAHPVGPMTPIYWGAGFAAIPAVSFLFAVALTAPVRAFAFSFFGSTLLDPGTPRFWIASVLLVLAGVLPLAHPGVRARLLRVAGRDVATPVDG